jgi:crotonobetainyl-CoA:carnitine CoA-transferase CaiB-like acyl-CoA transferase
MTEGALSDIRVLEMGQLIAGPFCGQLLGDFGAEVIKVEDPKGGDPLRTWGRMKDGQSLWWPALARNKRSVTLNLREPEGQALARDLASRCDVLIENFRPGAMERWGLGWEALSVANPGLIMVRVSGYGQTGPYRDRAGFGAIGEAMGGLRHVTGDPDRPPARAGISIGDSLTGMFAALGALTALHARARTGRGQLVDAALYESVLGVMESLVTDFDQAGYVRGRSGSTLPGIAPSNVYPCGDGRMVLIAANKDGIFARLCEAMGEPGLAADPRYATHLARGERMEEIDGRIAAWTAERASEAVLETMHAHAIPAGLIYTAPEMLADPHFAARGSIVEVDDPTFGRLKMHGVTPRLSATPGAVRRTGPALGEANGEVYGGLLGRPTDQLETLRAAGVI